MKKYILIAFLMVISIIGMAQEQKIIAKLGILEARFNGVDFTEWCMDKNNYLVLFTDEDNEVCLSNITNGGQSYGGVSVLDYKKIPETKETYETHIYQMRWKYHNTYDTHSGSSLIELTVIHKPHASSYELKMIQENMDVNIYKGYIDGSVDLSDF